MGIKPLPKNYIERKREAQKNEREGQRYKAIITALDSVANQLAGSNKRQNASQKKQDIVERKKARREYHTIVGLFLTAGFTLLGVAISGYQTYLNRQGLVATQTAASAAKESADTANAALIISQRPYISFIKFDVKPIVDDGTKKIIRWEIIPRWQNNGSTYAKGADVWASSSVLHGGDSDKFETWPPPGSPINAISDVGPKVTFSALRAAITVDDAKKMLAGDFGVALGSGVSYHDAFKSGREYRCVNWVRVTFSGPDIFNQNDPFVFLAYGDLSRCD